MTSRDSFGNACDRLVRLHLRQLYQVEFDVLDSVKRAQKVFGQVGFLIEVVSSKSMSMDAASLQTLNSIQTSCTPGRSSADQLAVFRRFGVQDLHSITTFFVQTLMDTERYEQNGCAAHAPDAPAIFVGSVATPWTLAHELGHVLIGRQSGHMQSDGHVMSPTWMIGTENPAFTEPQVKLMRKSPYALAH